MHSSDFSIRLCTLQELDDIMDLQDRICAAITQPDLFASTCREENASYLTPPNVIYGVFKQKRLIAYASLAFPKKRLRQSWMGSRLEFHSDPTLCQAGYHRGRPGFPRSWPAAHFN